MIISPAKAAEAASILCVELETLTQDELTRVYRDKAKGCHPDQNGSDKLELWSRVSWAKECLAHWLQQRPPATLDDRVALGPTCQKCNGSGRVKVVGRRFGTPLTMMCTVCRGVGTLEPEEDDHD